MRRIFFLLVLIVFCRIACVSGPETNLPKRVEPVTPPKEIILIQGIEK